MRNEKTEIIDQFLYQKVLNRLGLKEGTVSIQSEQWDLGMCDTCSFPESGFAVYVNDELVYPNDESLSATGGYIYGDRSGHVNNGNLSTYGYFFDWLDGKDLIALVEAEEEAEEQELRKAKEKS